MKPLRIGLTGGLASGKSTVAEWLAEAGFVTVDADRVVAELYAPGGAGAAAVAELFGSDMLEPSGAVRHDRVAARIFSDPEARRALEAAIHPLVRERFAELAAASAQPTVLEAALLVPAGYAPDFDVIVTVESDREERRRRAIARGLDPAAAEARLAAQGGDEARRAAADVILENDGTLAGLRRQVDALIAELRQRGQRP